MASSQAPVEPTALLKQRMRAAFRHLPQSLAGDEAAIHQMRVSGRRLRVALPLLARKPEGRRVRRALRGLRELTRVAGRSRDTDVILDLYQERLAVCETTPESRLLLRRLKETRRRSHRDMVEALLDLEIARLRRDLRAIVTRRAEGLFAVLLRLRQRREEGGSALLAEMAALGERFDVDALHGIRIETRRIRYTAELWDALKGQESEAPALFKELQERLGQIHDAWVLATWLGRQAAAAESRGNAALAACAGAHAAFFVEASRAHHRDLLARGPAELVRRGMDAMGAPRAA